MGAHGFRCGNMFQENFWRSFYVEAEHGDLP